MKADGQNDVPMFLIGFLRIIDGVA